ncbi:YqhG family protein [Effusibacillus lacus]|uniref:YqhG n=1 Tax=Effusibacillus lacus TaxID=1348429 RepID=A0A292YLS0_9BACL|nr:YqhG family protein [Effusibacillus lacus]TCS72552.1 uncharacterized protein YqhG [Effusibacillus lacus]GAX90888.1 hypothetical protein EFBL_2530 [Effusibacillus lacus]
MDKTQIRNYCKRYFAATGTPILREEPDYLQVELPIEIDKELTDRPYYWMWIEATGETPKPTVLNLIFDSNVQVDGVDRTELVTLGSFRLEKIFASATRRGQFVCQFQTGSTVGIRVPFLLTSLKISYIADRRKDEIRSYGINLRSNQVVRDLYEQVCTLPMTSQLPVPYTEQLANKEILAASLQTGWQRIQDVVMQEIQEGDHAWAAEAMERLAQEIEQLEAYYQSLALNEEETPSMLAAERELRFAELKWRCKPRIQIQPLHFGLLYLDPTQFTGTSART